MRNLSEFLSRLDKGTQRTYLPHLRFFEDFLRKNNLGVDDLKKRHIEQLIKNIDKLRLTEATKRKYLQSIRSYLTFLNDNGLMENNIKVPPPSSIRFLDFRSNKLIQQDTYRPPSIDEMRQILGFARDSNLRMFIALSILFINGMRSSELLTIRISNILHLTGEININGHLEEIETYLIKTGLDENASKTGTSYYFIPPELYSSYFFQEYLRHREATLRYYGGQSDFLFYSPQSTTGHLSTKTLRAFLARARKKLNLSTIRANPHIFRDVINEIRLERGCPYPVMEILLNHAPTGTNLKHYVKKLKNPLWRYYYFKRYTPIDEILLM